MRKKVIIAVASVFAASFLTFAVIATVLRPVALNVCSVNLSTIHDGEYLGVCQNKILFAVVRVDIKDHRYENIQVLYHKDAYKKQAQEIADRVVAAQSLNVDTVSGATLSSDTVLKAVENALVTEKP